MNTGTILLIILATIVVLAGGVSFILSLRGIRECKRRGTWEQRKVPELMALIMQTCPNCGFECPESEFTMDDNWCDACCWDGLETQEYGLSLESLEQDEDA